MLIERLADWCPDIRITLSEGVAPNGRPIRSIGNWRSTRLPCPITRGMRTAVSVPLLLSYAQEPPRVYRASA